MISFFLSTPYLVKNSRMFAFHCFIVWQCDGKKTDFVEEIIIMHGNETFKVNQTDYDLDLSWEIEDLKLYDHQSNPILATIFTMIAGITLVLGAIVHRAIFKLLKRIPQRPINAIIYPNLVCITFKTFHKITTITT